MRIPCLITLAIVTAACGASCPPEDASARNRNTSRLTQGDDTPVSGGSTDGRWLLLEDSRAEAFLEIDGNQATAIRIGHDDRISLEVVRRANGMLLLRHDGDDIMFVHRGWARAVLVNPGEGDVGEALRVVPVPQELQGDWDLQTPDSEVIHITVRGDTVESRAPGEVQSGPLYGLAVGDGGVAIALPRAEDPSNITIFEFIAVGDGSYVAWARGDEGLLVIHRPGARPSWLPQDAVPVAVPVRPSDFVRPPG